MLKAQNSIKMFVNWVNTADHAAKYGK